MDQVDSVLALVLIANPAVCTSPMTARETQRGGDFWPETDGFLRADVVWLTSGWVARVAVHIATSLSPLGISHVSPRHRGTQRETCTRVQRQTDRRTDRLT